MRAGHGLCAHVERSGTSDRAPTLALRRWVAAVGALAILALMGALPVAQATAAAGKPSSTAPPTVTGTPRAGATLTAQPGTWTGTQPITYRYAWRRCKPSGGGCVDIASAAEATYVLTARDGGSTIRVRVTARNSAGSTWADSAPTAVVESPPANTSPPTITGTPRDGETLSAVPGTWSGMTPIAYAHQWQRCDALAGCREIFGATGTIYQLHEGDLGFSIRVVVTASNAVGWSSAPSGQTAAVQAAAPVNTALPAISGTARDGETLIADPGGWSGTKPMGFGYRWRRCDATGGGCVDIPGAIDQSYAVVSTDVGARLRVEVTASNEGGTGSAVSAPSAEVTGVAPANTNAPTIAGRTTDGETLTAHPGGWSGTEPIGFGYQWQRCDPGGGACADIGAATDKAYALVYEDVDSTLRVVVTAANAGGSSSATSAATGAVQAAAPHNIDAPGISGRAQDGQTLTADAGTWTGTEPIAFGYRWRRCASGGDGCVDITGAAAARYTLVPADVGATLRVVVTASNAAGSDSATSAQTAVVATATDQAPVNTTPPTISGTARDGETLSADPGDWSGTSPMSFAYQWRRCDTTGGGCVNIVGATAQTYSVTSADVGRTLRLAVTASNVAGSGSAVSTATGTVDGVRPQNTTTPTVSGTPQVAQPLSGDPGSWSGTASITFAYQWRRCDGDGAACADIAGATVKTYTPVAGDVGSSLRVVVTATNAAGAATAMSAPSSAVTTAGSVGYRGPSFSGAGTAPTGSKPESKLWFNDGTWWASMWAGAGNGFHIFRLDAATQRWSDTGVALDDRSGTRADVLSDGARLYVASHVFSSCGCSTTAAGFPARLYRYSYDAGTKRYALDPGFPVAINNTKSETLVIDRDSGGTLWATWVQDRRVMMTHSQTGDDRSWVAPYVLPVTGAANANTDDISSLVAYGSGAIGVMWSNQTDSAFYFAAHADGAADSSWTVAPALRSPLIADDHLNLKSLQADGSGRVFGVAKTSLNDAVSPDAGAPIILLLVRTASGHWSNVPVWRIGDGALTRPILLIDESNLVVHVFATSSESGGTIRTKSSGIGSIAFPSGLGTTFLRDAANNALNNATSTKDNVTRESGLVLLASNDSTGYYWHNRRAVP